MPQPLSASDERHAILMRSLEQEIAFVVYALRGDQAIELDGWPERERAKLTYEARAVVARFDQAKLWAAELRAREALALQWQRVDYSHLTSSVQNVINHLVKIVLQSHQIALEGHSSPLAPSRAAELSPERRTM